jgi:hypothetical protein
LFCLGVVYLCIENDSTASRVLPMGCVWHGNCPLDYWIKCHSARMLYTHWIIYMAKALLVATTRLLPLSCRDCVMAPVMFGLCRASVGFA